MNVVTSQPVDKYISVVKHDSAMVDRPLDQDEDLRKQVEEWKKTMDQKPQDAYLDPVWKATPGYNGWVIDVEETLNNMEKTGKEGKEQIVWREVEPNVKLESLGAHPIYRGNQSKPVVSFMVNVAWGNKELGQILDILDKEGVKTTFFLDGSWVKKYPELAKEIANRGHEIGNHAYSHPDMSKLGPGAIRMQIGKTQSVIEKTTGIKPTLFAPPSGSFNQSTVDIAHAEFKMKTILWTADTVDWRNPPVDQMVERIRTRIGNGTLILMHPTESSAVGLKQMLQMAKQRGLTPTTVSEVLSTRRLDQPPGN
ncbi:polysaccharide deacetylase family protein [Brevibacillus dissolubilis]|uniref:polysaccharide deacetylase family protein n=1 Tax=Brevibacillus dissolubilis TaxID=1844116 RepID=UPI00210022B2|nr:polysaccharide deacetylase family protein [Brevibacillus dissolubilis]